MNSVHKYNSVELINTLTKEEAEIKYQEFVNDVKKHNKNNRLAMLFTVLGAMAIATFMLFVLPNDSGVSVMVNCGVCACFIVSCLMHNFKSVCDACLPVTYSYHKILEKYNILNIKACLRDDRTYSLVLDVANKDGQVSCKYLTRFDKIEKADVLMPTADLLNKKLYVPCNNTTNP